MKRYYVGLGPDGQRKLFRSASIPERETHGSIYNAVIGPFRTKRGAIFMRDYGRNNPHCQTVGDAEKLAAKVQSYATCQFRLGQPGMTWHCGQYTENGAKFCKRHEVQS